MIEQVDEPREKEEAVSSSSVAPKRPTKTQVKATKKTSADFFGDKMCETLLIVANALKSPKKETPPVLYVSKELLESRKQIISLRQSLVEKQRDDNKWFKWGSFIEDFRKLYCASTMQILFSMTSNNVIIVIVLTKKRIIVTVNMSSIIELDQKIVQDYTCHHNSRFLSHAFVV